jgi:short-subunit dehydrogenase
MKHDLDGRVVVITGASSGIGRAAALKFAEAGDTLVLAARRKSLLEELADECESMGVSALAVETDVSDAGDVNNLAKQALKKFGRIDVWVNDAGIGVAGKFDEIPLEEHQRVIETNLIGVINGSYAAIRQFRAQGEGVLINISSVLGKVTQPYMSSYTASKHGVRAISAAIRQELWLDKIKDINVSTVFPESVDTPFFQHEANRSGYKLQPMPPVKDPEEVAQVIFRMAEKPQDEVIVGKAGKWFNVQNKLMRRGTEKQMAWHADRTYVDRDQEEKEHSGALFKADRSGNGDIHGGWKNGNSEKKSSSSLSTIAMVAPAALGIYVLLKGRRSSQLRDVA